MRKNNLRRLRKRLCFTQVKLAKAAGTCRATLVLIERHNYYPTAEVRGRLAAALGAEETLIWPTLEVATDGK